MLIINKLRNQFLMVSTLILTLLCATTSYADTFTVEQLMQGLAKATPRHATFIETKQIALLDKPIVSSGELFFNAPNYLEKRTLEPMMESLVLDGNKIRIERGSKTYYFTLQNLPALGILINSIRGTLAGDLNTLKRHFQLHLAGNVNKWSLQLIPHHEKLKKQLTHIRIAGNKRQIQSIATLQADGDSAHMAITPVVKTP